MPRYRSRVTCEAWEVPEIGTPKKEVEELFGDRLTSPMLQFNWVFHGINNPVFYGLSYRTPWKTQWVAVPPGAILLEYYDVFYAKLKDHFYRDYELVEDEEEEKE